MVRVTLTDVGAVAVAAQLGPRVRVIDGRVVRRTDSTLVLAVASATHADGVEQTFDGDAVALSSAEVQEIGVARVAVGRSVVFGVALVAAAVTAAATIKGGSSEGGRRPGGGTEPGK